jgi:hypothetical protein
MTRALPAPSRLPALLLQWEFHSDERDAKMPRAASAATSAAIDAVPICSILTPDGRSLFTLHGLSAVPHLHAIVAEAGVAPLPSVLARGPTTEASASGSNSPPKPRSLAPLHESSRNPLPLALPAPSSSSTLALETLAAVSVNARASVAVPAPLAVVPAASGGKTAASAAGPIARRDPVSEAIAACTSQQRLALATHLSELTGFNSDAVKFVLASSIDASAAR